MDKGLSVLGMWLGPALAAWATHEPWVAIAFLASLMGTFAIYMDNVPKKEADPCGK